MTVSQIIGFVLLTLVGGLLWAGLRALVGPMKPPAGYDVVPQDWTVEAAKRAMRGEE